MTKRHDKALTPLNRLLTTDADMIDPHDLTRLQALLRDTDIEQLKHKISDIQANLLELARRRGQTERRARTNHVYLSRRKMPTNTRASSDESTTQARRAS